MIRRAASSSTDREPSRFAAVTRGPGFSSLSSPPDYSYVLRTGTVRGPIRSLMQPWLIRRLPGLARGFTLAPRRFNYVE
jgi:hypothetical protein